MRLLSRSRACLAVLAVLAGILPVGCTAIAATTGGMSVSSTEPAISFVASDFVGNGKSSVFDESMPKTFTFSFSNAIVTTADLLKADGSLVSSSSKGTGLKTRDDIIIFLSINDADQLGSITINNPVALGDSGEALYFAVHWSRGPTSGYVSYSRSFTFAKSAEKISLLAPSFTSTDAFKPETLLSPTVTIASGATVTTSHNTLGGFGPGTASTSSTTVATIAATTTTGTTKPAPTTPTTSNTKPTPTTSNTKPTPTTSNTKPTPTTSNTKPTPTTTTTVLAQAPTDSSSSNSKKAGSGGLGGGVIAGIVVGVLAALAVAVTLLVWWFVVRRRKHRRNALGGGGSSSGKGVGGSGGHGGDVGGGWFASPSSMHKSRLLSEGAIEPYQSKYPVPDLGGDLPAQAEMQGPSGGGGGGVYSSLNGSPQRYEEAMGLGSAAGEAGAAGAADAFSAGSSRTPPAARVSSQIPEKVPVPAPAESDRLVPSPETETGPSGSRTVAEVLIAPGMTEEQIAALRNEERVLDEDIAARKKRT